ncbi:MAG: helix-turn-helix domain-containing protein [candidate division Zixibacteria bacterium]
MGKRHFTTSEVARLLSVAPDTVLKWVKAGKIASYRTPGGHSRIPAEAIEKMLPDDRLLKKSKELHPDRNDSFQYCWEFFAKSSGLNENCQHCIAYRSRSQRCYEMKHIPKEFGHLKLYCKDSCEECEYYLLTHFENKL